MSPGIRKRWITLLSHVLAFWASIGIVVGSLGLPMLAPRAAGAFPCQGHGCGCSDAESCWFGCCCLTPAQRLAWAAENSITPPEAFLAAFAPDEAERKSNAPSQLRCCAPATEPQEHAGQPEGIPRATCCSATTPSCCASQADNVSHEDCQDAVCDSVESQSEKSPPSDWPCIGTKPCGGPAPQWIAGGQHLGMPLHRATLERSSWKSPVATWEPRFEADRDSPPTRPG